MPWRRSLQVKKWASSPGRTWTEFTTGAGTVSIDIDPDGALIYLLTTDDFLKLCLALLESLQLFVQLRRLFRFRANWLR